MPVRLKDIANDLGLSVEGCFRRSEETGVWSADLFVR